MALPRAQSVPPGRSVPHNRPYVHVSHPSGMYADSTTFPGVTPNHQSELLSLRSDHMRHSGRLIRRNMGKPQYHRAQDSWSTLGDRTPSSLRSRSPVSLRDDSSSPDADFFQAPLRDTERYLVWMPSIYSKNARYSWMMSDEIGQRPQREPRSPLEELQEKLELENSETFCFDDPIATPVESLLRHSEEACGVKSMPSVLKPARGRPVLSRPNAQGNTAVDAFPSFRMPSKPYMVFLTGKPSVGATEVEQMPVGNTLDNREANAEQSSENDTQTKPQEGSSCTMSSEGKGSLAPDKPRIETGASVPTAADFSPSRFDYEASPTILEYYYRTVFAACQGAEDAKKEKDISPDKTITGNRRAQQGTGLQEALQDSGALPSTTVSQPGNIQIKSN